MSESTGSVSRPFPKPRRSVLFMPATNAKAVRKAPTLDVDTIILDMEDSVHQQQKSAVRDAVRHAVTEIDFGYREVLVRINALDTTHWQEDLDLLVNLGEAATCHGLVVPKVESVAQLELLVKALGALGALGTQQTLAVWIMIESPAAVLAAADLCGFGSPVSGVLIGTADLCKDLGIVATPDRAALQFALSSCVLAARAANIAVIDGVYMNFKDDAGLEAEALQGMQFGFDGKSLIHPAQLAVCNRVFAPSDQEVSELQALVDAWQQANAGGEAVCVHNGKLVEGLHVKAAEDRLALHQSIKQRKT